MAKLRWFVCLLGLLVLPAAGVMGQAEGKDAEPEKRKAKKAEGKAKVTLRGEYGLMAREADLSDEQKAKLQELVKEMNKAVAEATKASKEKVAEQKKAIAAAKKAKDKAAEEEARKKLKEAQQAPQAVKAEHAKKIVGVMTAEQRVKWGQFRLYRSMCQKFAKAKLTKDQKQTVRTLSGETAKELGDLAACTTTEEEKAKVDAASGKLAAKITTEVLTDKQRKAMEKKGKGKKKKGKEAARAKKAKEADEDEEKEDAE